MSDAHPSIYTPGKGWLGLDAYYEPSGNIATFRGPNGITSVKGDDSDSAREWVARLEKIEPNGLHALLVSNRDIPKLFHPCVYDDPESESAIGGDGCVCRQTYIDPLTALPVVAEHYRTVSGNIEHWTYYSLTTAGLPEDEEVESIVIDPHEFWMRLSSGDLHYLPRTSSAGYGVGYGGGGPHQLCHMIEQLIASKGTNSAPVFTHARPNRGLFAWVSDAKVNHIGTHTLDELAALMT